MKWVGIVLKGSAEMEAEEVRIESRCGCSVAVIFESEGPRRATRRGLMAKHTEWRNLTLQPLKFRGIF